MIFDEIKQALNVFPELTNLSVEGDGHHFQIKVVSKAFHDKSKIARQRLVYQYLNPMILSGRLHAVELTTLTPEEWDGNE